MKTYHIETPTGVKLETAIKKLYRSYAKYPVHDRDYIPKALMDSVKSILNHCIVVTEVK